MLGPRINIIACSSARIIWPSPGEGVLAWRASEKSSLFKSRVVLLPRLCGIVLEAMGGRATEWLIYKHTLLRAFGLQRSLLE